MKRHSIKNHISGAALVFGISLFFSTFLMQEKSAQAQHAGGGIIDTSKQPGTNAPSFHSSFAPYEGTIPIPWVDEKPNPITIKVTEVITYEIPRGRKKKKKKKKKKKNKLKKSILEIKKFVKYYFDIFFFFFLLFFFSFFHNFFFFLFFFFSPPGGF